MPPATQQRTNNGWLEPLERPTLAALAARMPSWVTPDFLTTIGFAGARRVPETCLSDRTVNHDASPGVLPAIDQR